MIRDKAWDREAREEFDAARREAWQYSDRQSERNDRYIEILRDGVQAQRRWAKEALAEAQRTGGAAQLKTWHRQQRTVAVAFDGEVITKSRTVGVRRRDEDGESYDTQTLFDFTTWEELDQKRAEILRVVRAYNSTVAMIDRLLALHDVIPAATNPAEAAKAMGTSLDEWLEAAA